MLIPGNVSFKLGLKGEIEVYLRSVLNKMF